MSSKAPRKLMIVRNEAKAEQLRQVMGKDWMVVGFMNALSGRSFDLILLVDQPEERVTPEKWISYIETRVKTKLSPGGKMIEVY